MMNGQSRETGNIGHIGFRKSTNSNKKKTNKQRQTK
jgi:hypothetical protein